MDKKKLAAAISAVTTFIKTEEAAVNQYLTPDNTRSEGLSAPPIFRSNIWGTSGRQELMRSNSMIQLRMFK